MSDDINTMPATIQALRADVARLTAERDHAENDRKAWRQEFLDKNEDYGIALQNMDYFSQRGDRYRARALAMVTHCRDLRVEVRSQLTALKIGECLDVVEPLSERYNAKLADAEARYAAALADGEQAQLAAEAAEKLLGALMVYDANVEYLTLDELGAYDALRNKITALLAERAAREPKLADLRGIAPNATGGVPSEEFVSRLRDEWDGDIDTGGKL